MVCAWDVHLRSFIYICALFVRSFSQVANTNKLNEETNLSFWCALFICDFDVHFDVNVPFVFGKLSCVSTRFFERDKKVVVQVHVCKYGQREWALEEPGFLFLLL